MIKFGARFAILFLISSVLFAQEAKEIQAAPQSSRPALVIAEMEGYRLTESELQRIIKLMPEPIARQMQDPNRQMQVIRSYMQMLAFSNAAESEGIDQDPEFVQQIELYGKQLLAERYRNRLTSEIGATPEEAQDYYQKNRDKFARKGQVHLFQIFVPTQERAQEIKAALDAGGSFEKLAAINSTDALTKNKGGDAGWVLPASLEPALAAVVSQAPANVITEPVQVKQGWAIVKVGDRKPDIEQTFDQVRETITRQLIGSKRQQAVDKATQELFAKYKVVFSF